VPTKHHAFAEQCSTWVGCANRKWTASSSSL